MKKKMGSILVALPGCLVVLGIIIGCIYIERPRKLVAPVLLMGDSIFGQYREENSVNYYLEQELKEYVFNAAFGGSSMASNNKEGRESNFLDYFNFPGLSLAIAQEDFGVQQTVRTKDMPTSHFPEIVDDLDCLDMNQVRVLVLCYGLNDYMAGIPLENPKDPYDIYTFAGAMRTGVERLQKAYPDLRIMVFSSTYCWFLNSNEDCEQNNYGGGYLEDYVETERRVAKELGLEFYDLFHDVYIHDAYPDWEIYTEDGVHPNEQTRKWLAQLIADRIKEGDKVYE